MMEMQGNATEIDERNLLQLDALLSHGYGLSPQLVMRSKGLSIEAKALYGYLSSFAGAGDTAFPSTSRILEELDISKNRFYKIRKIIAEATATAIQIAMFTITSGFVIRMKRFALALAACSSFSIDLALFFATSSIAFVPACTVSSTACVAPSVTAFVTVSAYLSPCSKLATILLRLF